VGDGSSGFCSSKTQYLLDDPQLTFIEAVSDEKQLVANTSEMVGATLKKAVAIRQSGPRNRIACRTRRGGGHLKQSSTFWAFFLPLF
jgi:hypothetical protein